MHTCCKKCHKRETKYDDRPFKKPCSIKYIDECPFGIQYPLSQYFETLGRMAGRINPTTPAVSVITANPGEQSHKEE